MRKPLVEDYSLLVRILFPEATSWLILAEEDAPNADLQAHWCQGVAELVELLEHCSDCVLINLTGQVVVSDNILAEISFSRQAKGTQLAYFCNPDGSLRWLFPAGNTSAYFLHLYSGSGWRGRALRQFLKWGFRLKLGRFLRHGMLCVRQTDGQAWHPVFQSIPGHQYAVFTGTKGENRKAVIAAGAKHRPDVFYKLPLTEQAEGLVMNEAKQLAKLAHSPFRSWKFPKAVIENGVLRVSNVQPTKYSTATQLTALHFQAITELSTEQYSRPLHTAKSFQQIQYALEELESLPDHPQMDKLVLKDLREQLRLLNKQINPFQSMVFSLAHGDFTPWNMFVGKNSLSVFDWELARQEPLAFDLFHFVLQSNCLIHRAEAAVVKEEVDRVLTHSFWQAHLPCDPEQYWRYYLLRHLSYYLPRYLKQQDLHQQVHWQLELWRDLLLQLQEVQKISNPSNS